MNYGGRMKVFLLLPLLFMQLWLFSQPEREAKVANLYRSLKEYDIECPKTVLAIVVFETGWDKRVPGIQRDQPS